MNTAICRLMGLAVGPHLPGHQKCNDNKSIDNKYTRALAAPLMCKNRGFMNASAKNASSYGMSECHQYTVGKHRRSNSGLTSVCHCIDDSKPLRASRYRHFYVDRHILNDSTRPPF